MITLHKSGHCTERLDRVPRTSLRTSISARGWRAMRTDVHETTPESLASKSFRSSSTNGDQPQPEISGFGVRVPGGAQTCRSEAGSASEDPSQVRFTGWVSLLEVICDCLQRLGGGGVLGLPSHVHVLSQRRRAWPSSSAIWRADWPASSRIVAVVFRNACDVIHAMASAAIGAEAAAAISMTADRRSESI